MWLAERSHPTEIYIPPFRFLESISTCWKPVRFICSYLRYIWFKNSSIWWTENIFDLTQLKIFKSPFIFLQYLNIQKSSWLTKSLLRHSRLKNIQIRLAESCFDHVQLNKPLCFLNLYYHAKNQVDSSRFSWDRANLRILQSHWLAYNFRTRIFPDICKCKNIIIWTRTFYIDVK